jgi:hypothetical protein
MAVGRGLMGLIRPKKKCKINAKLFQGLAAMSLLIAVEAI